MSSILGREGENPISPVLENVRHEQRRRILNVLRGTRGSIGEAALARRLVDDGEETSAEVDEDVRSTHVELVHAHLPSLDDADLVAWDEEEGTVEMGTNPVLHASGFRRALEREGDAWDELLACLANERRRDVVAVLQAHDGPMPRRALAHEVVAREDGGDPSSEAVESALRSLHHVHLPKLRAADVIEYDADEGTVADADNPDVAALWFDTRLDETPATVPRWLARSPG